MVEEKVEGHELSGCRGRAGVDDAAMGCGLWQLPWNIHYLSMWTEPADNIAYTKDLSAAMKPWTAGPVYLSWIGDEGPDRVVAAFGPEKYGRLQAIKAAWDLQNLFRHTQNITPWSSSREKGVLP